MRMILAALTLSFCASGAGATELDGAIRGVANGSTVTVTCGDSNSYVQSRTLDAAGRYRFADLPDNSACRLHIEDGSAKSAPHEFRSMSGKLTINREVRNISGRLVAL